MTDYTFNINGIQYKVENAKSFEEAQKGAQEQYHEDLSQKAKSEFSEAPTWAKPFMAAQDIGRSALDTFTMGGVDKFADYMSPPASGQPSQGDITRAVRSRMGGADIGADIAAGVAQPSAVPGLVARMGGAPLVRKGVGLLGSALEGGAYGAGSALGHDENAASGAISGAAGGMLGRTIADTLAYPVNKVAKWWTGASDALPISGGATRVTKKTSPEKRVETAVARAERDGGRPSDYREQFEAVRKSGMPGFSKKEVDMVQQIIEGDPGTKLARYGASNLTAATGAFTGAVTGAHSPLAGLLLAGTVPLGGIMAGKLAGQGKMQSVEALRRAMLGKPKYEGILAAKGKKRITGGVREYYDSEEE